MAYRDETIANIINRLNKQYFLPAIQREFVWKPKQIIQLFDSIMRGYPISSFLFWELNPNNHDKWETYRIIEEASPGVTHNVKANTAAIQQLTLILDGQQRLTSLLIGLKGSFHIKQKYKQKNNPNAWTRQQLYLDLIKDPSIDESEDDSEMRIRYGFSFFDKDPKQVIGHYWLKVGNILAFDSEDTFDDFKQNIVDNLHKDTTKGQIAVLNKNLSRLYSVIWKDPIIAYHIEFDQNYDRVLDIFIRANEGGTKLSKSDILLSMITSRWGKDARVEIYKFLDHINTNLTGKNNLDKDFIMKTCLVLTDLPVTYKVQNFNNDNLSLIQRNWEQIKRAIQEGVDLTNSFGINRENLTSKNTLIPIIYYIYQHPSLILRGTKSTAVESAKKVRKWLIMALLNGVLGGSSDNMLNEIRRVIKEHSSTTNFPIDQINKAIKQAGRIADFDDIAVGKVLSLEYGNQLTFLALSLIYDNYEWGVMRYDIDHIFASNAFKKRELESIGKDHLGNLMLLMNRENKEKSDKPLDQWLATRNEGFRQRHLIPDDSSLWKLERFEDFLKAREHLIEERLKNLFLV